MVEGSCSSKHYWHEHDHQNKSEEVTGDNVHNVNLNEYDWMLLDAQL